MATPIRNLVKVIMSNIRFTDGFKTPFWVQKLQWILNPIGYMETAHMQGNRI